MDTFYLYTRMPAATGTDGRNPQNRRNDRGITPPERAPTATYKHSARQHGGSMWASLDRRARWRWHHGASLTAGPGLPTTVIEASGGKLCGDSGR